MLVDNLWEVREQKTPEWLGAWQSTIHVLMKVVECCCLRDVARGSFSSIFKADLLF